MRSSRKRTLVALGVVAAALVYMVVALWPQSDEVLTDAERTEQIASKIRCPFCNGESIADATSQVARDLEIVIGEQVAAGMSNDEIFDYFAARYGENLLLDPPLLGWGVALWVVPLLAAFGGVLLVMRRRRRLGAVTAPIGNAEMARLADQLQIVEREKAEVAAQVREGELDAATADRLEASLHAEADELSRAMEAPPAADGADSSPSRINRRALVGVGLLLVGAVAVGGTLALTADDGGDGGIVDAPPIDLATITSDRLAEVVEANPEVVPMRLFLAGMLLEEGEVLAAAQQYGEVLQRQEHPEALAGLGWISFLVEEHATAEEYLMDALEMQPDFPQAQWWLANVRLIGLGDAAGAIEPLEALLASGAAPEEVRVLAEDMLEQARNSL